MNINTKVYSQLFDGKCRFDGRGYLDRRLPSITYSDEDSLFKTCSVLLGKDTECLCSFSAEIVVPRKDRPNKGNYHVKVTKAGSTFLRSNREILHGYEKRVETVLSASNLFDLSSWCITRGSAVWDVTLHIIVLKNGGNLLRAILLAVSGCLLHSRIPSTSIGSNGMVKITKGVPIAPVRNPTPVCVTIQEYIKDGEKHKFLDPTKEEEAFGTPTKFVIAYDKSIVFVDQPGVLSPSDLVRNSQLALLHSLKDFKKLNQDPKFLQKELDTLDETKLEFIEEKSCTIDEVQKPQIDSQPSLSLNSSKPIPQIEQLAAPYRSNTVFVNPIFKRPEGSTAQIDVDTPADSLFSVFSKKGKKVHATLPKRKSWVVSSAK